MYLFATLPTLWQTFQPQDTNLVLQSSYLGINFDDFDKEAIVEEIIKPGKCGRVRYHGSWWQARCVEAVTIAPGATVYVVCRHALTLIVRPIGEISASE
ncbi:MAG: NfeD family protein [Jaaginema sp. PMC 1079.18]|nr:NfeD family protein [Jaaginema sp. PMC 1080.18]MEC4850283.1 NfeD family protein [Jaaginema sp. PMC 1079.18]MEC4867394.1 NfeD family protein [Jaaginema sp. PMC 1078.18]